MKIASPPLPSSWRALGRCLPFVGLLAACTPTDSVTSEATRTVGQVAQTLGSTLLVGAETSAGPSSSVSSPQVQPVVAAGPGMYLVVWVGDGVESPPDLRGVRIRASDGLILDSAPLLLSSDFVDDRPSVAFDGTNFLVSWTDPSSSFNSRGVRVRAADGVLLDSSPLQLTSHESFQVPASLTFDGTNFLAVYRGLVFNSVDDTYTFQALVNRIQPDGTLLDTQSLKMGAVLGGNASAVHAASLAGTTLVAWTTEEGVRMARVDSTGQLLDTSPLPASSMAASKVRVAARPGEFLVVWNEGSSLKARRVRASDGALLDASALAVGTSAQLVRNDLWPETPFDVTFDGQDYRVLWQSTQPEYRLVTTRVSPTGTLGAQAEDTLATYNAATTPDWVGLAAQGPGSFLVTYTQRDPASGYNRVQFRRVSPNDCDHDVTPPTVTCPATLVQECVFSAQKLVPDTDFDDNCGLSAVNTYPQYYGSPGTFTSTVSAVDLSGNSTSCSTAWTVVDTRKPNLYLEGPGELTLRYGEPYDEPGAYGDDLCDGYYTYNRVQVFGTVNSWQPGYYGITYVLTDYAGNQREAIRFVRVLEP